MFMIQHVLSKHVCGRYWKNLAKQFVVSRSIGIINEGNVSNKQVKTNIPNPEPGKIQAAVLKNLCSPLVIENIQPCKCPGFDEVLIDVHYCALNPSDILLRQNLYSCEPNLPLILGYELVGELMQVGENAKKNGYKVGDKVVALKKNFSGGFAEQCVADISDIWKLPENIQLVDGACLLEDYIIALIGLEQIAAINENDLMIAMVCRRHSTFAAIDIATNVYKAQVIGVCDNNDDAAIVRSKGILKSLLYNEKALIKDIQKIANTVGVNDLFECKEGEYFKKILKSFTNAYSENEQLKDLLRDDSFSVMKYHLSREARIIIAGIKTTQEITSEGLDSLDISGLNLKEYRKNDPEMVRQIGEDVLQFYEDGLISPYCASITGLYNINNVFDDAINSKISGKVVIDIKNKTAQTTKAD